MFNKPNFTYEPEKTRGMGDIANMNPFQKGIPSIEQQLGFNPAQPGAKDTMLGHGYANDVYGTARAGGPFGAKAPGTVMSYLARPAEGANIYEHVNKLRDGEYDV
jgi:hypothetical protein